MVFFSLKMQRRLIQTKVYSKRLYCLERNFFQTIKTGSCKKDFPKYVYQWSNCLSSMFFIPCDRWKMLISFSFIVTQKFGVTAMFLSFLKQAFWKKFEFYICYPHNDITMLLISKVYYILNKIYLSLGIFHSFSLWIVPHFSM